MFHSNSMNKWNLVQMTENILGTAFAPCNRSSRCILRKKLPPMSAKAWTQWRNSIFQARNKKGNTIWKCTKIVEKIFLKFWIPTFCNSSDMHHQNPADSSYTLSRFNFIRKNKKSCFFLHALSFDVYWKVIMQRENILTEQTEKKK